MRLRVSTVAIAAVVLAAMAFLAAIGNRVLDGDVVSFQFYADSVTYEKTFRGDVGSVSSAQDIVAADRNYLGPLLLLSIVGGNRWGVLGLNCLLFASGVLLLAKVYPLRRPLLVGLLATSPLLFSSLISVNKEIFLFLAVCLLMYGLPRRSFLAIGAAMVTALLARWQAVVFVVVFMSMYSGVNPLRQHRLLSLALLVAVLTLVYPSTRIIFAAADQIGAEGALTNEGSGIYSRMIEVQNSYGYFLIVIPKTLQVIFGPLFKVGQMFPWKDFYNDVMLVWQAVMSLGLLVALMATGRFRLSNDFVYASLVYCVIFALTPIYAPRYFFAVYVLWAIAMSLPQEAPWERVFMPRRTA